MPPSSPGDRLAKALHPFLARKISVPALKDLGWYDFLSSDRPETSDALQMASSAFLYLSVDQVTGAWTGLKAVLAGIVAFLHDRTGQSPTSIDLADLKVELENARVNQQAIGEWFERVYR